MVNTNTRKYLLHVDELNKVRRTLMIKHELN